MKKIYLIFTLFLSFALMSFSTHKFYVSIYQIEFAEDKKMVQITSRIFIDDLNAALEKKYGTRANFGEPAESTSDLTVLKKYVAENFLIRVNGRPEPLEFLSREYEANVIICYFRIKNISKIKSLQIKNTLLTEYVTEQQNIIQTKVYGKKKSVVLSADNTSADIEI
jgi:hypothetical protein